jgi:hydrogenase expression/formation protein HypD
MAFDDYYRDSSIAEEIIKDILSVTTRRWRIMEICGGQTHALLRTGIDQRLSEAITLIHGPGCPVCVTSPGIVDSAISLTRDSSVILCSFGDMIRVPGNHLTLREARALGGAVEIVYSPLDALNIARDHPNKEIVFFGIGFETTAPTVALSILLAASEQIENYSVLSSHLLVPPALVEILSSADAGVEGILAAGHVCAVMGYHEYRPVSERFRIPIVVTGFEPVDLLRGIYGCIVQLEKGEADVDNQYQRVVVAEGNRAAREALLEVFEISSQRWRGFGSIEASGLKIRTPYRKFDAFNRFSLSYDVDERPCECISGLVLRGIKTPLECPAFGTRCTLDHPLGATMVSDEGACSAYMHYRRG